MNKFDKLYTHLMEMMTAGGMGSVLGSPASGPIGNTGGAFPGGSDSYATGSNVMPKSIFGGPFKRNLNFNKESKKNRKRNSKK
jgi:hypothetical protein